MISFSCPKCRTKVQRSDAEAGTKVICPACNQKLLVPTPPRLEKTMLGVLQPAPDPRTMLGQLSSGTPAPPPSPVRIPAPALPVAQLSTPSSEPATPALPVAQLLTPVSQPANADQEPWGFDTSTPAPRSRSKPPRQSHPLAKAAAVVFIGLVGLVVVGGGLASFINSKSESWEDRDFRRKQQELEIKRKEAELDRIRYPALYGGSSSTETRPANRPSDPGWNDPPAQPGWNDRPPPPRQPAACSDCKGSGVSMAVCTSCRGSGVGSSGMRACSVCNGRRFNSCFRCNGTGKGGYFNP